MGLLQLEQIEFSEQVQQEWADPTMYERLKQGLKFENPGVELQVKL
jgi:6-pyruvoyltetrahydropterin/6-carboxytetrahydropterin synthase